MKTILTCIASLFVSLVANAQIDKTGYSLVYSSETPEAAAADMELTDAEKANCSSDFMSIANMERNWRYSPRQTSTWNKRMAVNDEGRTMVHLCEGDGILQLLAYSPDETVDGFITSGVEMKNSYKYGIVEVKARCHPHASNFPAVWMMPKDQSAGWPNCGEMDIMEQIGTSGVVYSTVHLGARYDQGVGKDYQWSSYLDPSSARTKYHIYSLLWNETSLTFYCDGTQVFQYTKDSSLDIASHPEYEHAQFPYNEPYYVILDQALGMQAWTWESEDPDPEYTYAMDVQYVRIFQNPEEMAGIKDVNSDTAADAKAARKIIRNGSIVISNNGKEYNVAGARTK